MEPQPAALPGNVPPPPPPPPPPPTPHPPPATLDPRSFRRVGRSEDPGPPPLPGLPADVLHMRVREGSKIRNLLRFATARMQGGGRGEAGALRQVVFTGWGRSLTKTVTCVEILKRQVGGLHQVSKLCNKTVSEAWESLQEGVPGVTVCRAVAALSILLSKDPLDPREPGYQPPLDPRQPGYLPPLDPRDPLDPREPGYQPPLDPREPGYQPPLDPQQPGYQPPLGLHTPQPEGARRDQAQRGDPGGPCSQHMPSGAKRARLEQGDRDLASTSLV